MLLKDEQECMQPLYYFSVFKKASVTLFYNITVTIFQIKTYNRAFLFAIFGGRTYFVHRCFVHP